VAAVGGLTSREYFEIADAAEREPVKVTLGVAALPPGAQPAVDGQAHAGVNPSPGAHDPCLQQSLEHWIEILIAQQFGTA
jgi:hypothetical protein